jgi:polyhydroxybutyrate depolymerase
MQTNNPRERSRLNLSRLAVVLAVSACGSAESDGAAPAGSAGLAGGTNAEPVSETPTAPEGAAETTGDTSSPGAANTGGSSPESVGGAAFDGAGGSTGEANGAAQAGADGETPAAGGTAGEAVVAPPACAIARAGGVVNQPLTSGGREREYRLFVPDSYDGQTRLPLIFNLHGSGGNAAGQAADSGMESLAQEEGFLVIGLQGFQNNWNVLMNDPNAADDVQYTRDVLDDALRRVCVDERRVFATGFSGGARMSSRLACNLGDRIAAIAPVSGVRWTAPCDGRAVPVVTFHGLADPQNTYAGMARNDWVESVEAAVEGWANHNGCDEARNETPEVNLVSVYSYGNCSEGADVVLYRVAGLGHTWAKSEIDATREMWAFFGNHAMP